MEVDRVRAIQQTTSHLCRDLKASRSMCDKTCSHFFDGYCSTVQGLLDWFEVDLGFTRAFIYSN